MGPSKVKALCVATRCATIEQFIATFHRFCDERSFFVATLNARPIGLETSFSIQLQDRTPVLRGMCVVEAAWAGGNNPFRRPGIQLGIKRLTPDSEAVFNQLQLARRSAPAESTEFPADAPSETPVPVTMPAIPTSKPPIPIPALSRTTTSTRRAFTEPVPAVTAPPKSPPEVKLLEVILPPAARAPEVTIETTQVQDLRTPGSELILPANPLMNLTDESLEGFVDCTLYEETATFFRSADDGSDIGEPAAPPRPVVPALPTAAIDEAMRASSGLFALQPSGEMVPIVVENPATGELTPVVVDNRMPTGMQPIVEFEGRAHRSTGQQMVPELRPNRLTGSQVIELRPNRPTGQQQIPVSRTTTGTIPPIILGSSQMVPLPANPPGSQVAALPMMSASQVGMMPMPPEPPRRFLGDESVHTPVPAGEAFVAMHHDHARSSPLATLAQLPRRFMVIGGAALGATLIFVIVIVMATGSSSADGDTKPVPAKETSQTIDPPKVARPASTKPEPKPAIVEGNREGNREGNAALEPTEPTEPAGPPLVGEGACKVHIETTPAGTMVVFDGRSVGPSPITIAGSCDRHKVDFMHPRYKSEQRFVTMTADKTSTVDVSLVRPTHSLRVVTSPPGAAVFIGGRRAGMSPTVLQINGFSGIDVRIERAGFKSVTKRVYSKVPADKLLIGMIPLPRPK